ncbi:hypothetical protein K469DRAFT_95459 [Zopfia rhizophila CBS 207.26]|uniref:HTH psq-type domain-containing protein n=1 Tax=Zopfia rhizophila CBS 207.26 TaxID=1314779 RepID=A0A6A6E963_9PEZI|nr:hypothetical protein K469DRAFT_95459 [Zopfia rhizophila CBS 207.26]
MPIAINAMPPKQDLEAIHKEGRLVLAVNAYRKGQITSVKQAAAIYRVNADTLRRRLNGAPARADTTNHNRNLNDNDEATLTEHILDLAARGYPPRKKIVEDMANMLLALRSKRPVGKN